MKLIAGAAIAALVTTSLSAQTGPTPAATTVSAGALLLNAGTPITLAVSQEVNSSINEAGDTFPLTVLNDVAIGNTIVIPRGTPAVGEITWRTGKGAFGKSGKMELSLRYIELNGQRIPVTGDFRQEGEGNTIATGVAIIAVGVFAGFVTGKRARLPVGRELMAQLAQPVPFTADGRLAPAFDSAAAMATAELSTPLGQCRSEARTLDEADDREEALEDCYIKRME